MKRRTIRTIPLVVAAMVAASCSSGESAITAGNDATTTVAADEPAVDDTVDGSTTGDEPADTATEPSDAGDTADTTTTTVVSPLAEFPACPTDALDTAGDVVEITFWHGLNVESENALQKVTDDYNASQDRVHVTLQNQGGYLETIDEYFQSSEGSRPDLVMFPEYSMQQAIDSDTLIPAGACIESAGFDTSPLQPSILQAYATSGVQWGIAFNVSNPVLYYNRKMFAAAGLDPDQPPRSLDEVRSYSQQLVDSGAATYGIAVDSGLDSGGGWFLEQWLANAGEPFANNDNGRSGPATEVYFDGEVGVELLTFLQDLVQDGLAFYVGDDSGGTDRYFKLADPDEPAAMTIGSSAAIGSIIAALGSGLVEGLTTEDVGVGPLPGPSGTPSAIVGGAATYIVAGQGDAEAAAAWDFITYLVSPEVQSEWTVLTGYLPIRDDALEIEPAASTFANDPRYRVAYDQLLSSTDIAANGPLLGPHRQVRSAMADAVAAILTGADVASTLEQAASLAEAYLADYAANN
jgi:sn-glycerol 3-phosphate transport system substrate-binding protein